jgi:hypothetical protein
MPERFIDFDAARAEREREPLRLKAFGRTFDLPSEMPASLFLDLIRLEEEKGSTSKLTLRDSLRLMRHVLPQAVLDELLQHEDLGLEEFAQLINLIVQAYKGEGMPPGESPAPNRATRRATAKTSTRARGSHVGSSSPSSRAASPGRTSSSPGHR